MTTDKPRIQVTLDKETNGLLSSLARAQEQSKSSVAADLIREALELHEDLYLSKLAKKRDTKKTTWLKDHDDIWE